MIEVFIDKKFNYEKKNIFFLFLGVLFSHVAEVHCQAIFHDYGLASIAPDDHLKSFRSLSGRTAIETQNEMLHKKVKKNTLLYRLMSDSVDYYQKAFGWVDLAYSSLRTVYSVKNTFETVTGRLEDVLLLIDTYRTECLAKRRVSRQDTLVYAIGRDLCNDIINDCKLIYKESLKQVPQFFAGTKCTTQMAVKILDDIDAGLHRLVEDCNRGYWKMYCFIQMRMGYWKTTLKDLTPLKKIEHANRALVMWRRNLRKTIKK